MSPQLAIIAAVRGAGATDSFKPRGHEGRERLTVFFRCHIFSLYNAHTCYVLSVSYAVRPNDRQAYSSIFGEFCRTSVRSNYRCCHLQQPRRDREGRR